MTEFLTVTLIGYGEVGQALASDLSEALPQIVLKAFDLKFADSKSKSLRALGQSNVVRCQNAIDAARGADLIISAVTAAQTVEVAKSVSGGIGKGVWFLDLNSASPESKTQAAMVIERAGGRYVEAAVMSPIDPRRMASPILLGGAHATAFTPLIRALGFTGAKFCSETLGKASATKLCRSVMIKGLEALISESLLSARFYGVEDEVLASLNNLFPHPDWKAYARYMISRTLEHGGRRSEEMFEAAKTVAGAGIEPRMSLAAAETQAAMATYAKALDMEVLVAMLDAVRAQLNPQSSKEAAL